MIDNVVFMVTLLSAVGSGLVAGIFFIFSNTVMNALAQQQPSQGIRVMQAINRTILNPLFFILFFGTAAASALLASSLLWTWQTGSIYLLAGSLLYLLGTFLVTIAFNVPMNESLDATEPGSAEAARLWKNYLHRWTAWNHVRTAACFMGAVSFSLALCC